MASCEDLATKAELQELRDQLNAVLGEKEEGGTESLFEKGKSPGFAASALGVTLLGLTKTRAANAIVDIGVDKAAEGVIWKELAQGKAKWLSTKGNGTKKSITALNKVSKVAGQARGVAGTASQVSSKGAAGVMLLANLASIAASLGLNIATVKVLDKRIDAEATGMRESLDFANSSMLRLYDKAQGNIDTVTQQIAENQTVVNNNRAAIQATKFEVSNAMAVNADLAAQLSQSRKDARTLQNDNKKLLVEVGNLDVELGEVKAELTTSINTIDAQLTKALEMIETQEKDVTTTDEELEFFETQLSRYDSRIGQVESEIATLQAEFSDLKSDLQEGKEARDAKSKLAEAKAIIIASRTNSFNDSLSSRDVVDRFTASQNSILSLASGVAGHPITIDPITDTSLSQDPNKFQDQLDQLLKTIGTGSVEQKQLDKLKADLNIDFKNTLDAGLKVGVIDALKKVNFQTNQQQLRKAAESAICNSLNGTGCPSVPGIATPTQGLGGMLRDTLGKIDSLNAGLNATIIAQNTALKGIVQSTNNTVLNATHGLQAVQNFASTAWKATKADKILGAVNTALLVHNGMMLSNNLASTLSEALNVSLQALGIRDETDSPIDIGRSVGDKIQSMLTSVLGTENYAALTVRIAKANRIYQAGANILQTTQELFDSARTIAELAAENTGQIGNALLEAGVVYEDAYREMLDEVNEKTTAMHKLDKLRAGIETAEKGLSFVNEISSEAIDIQENMEQLRENREAWDKEVEDILVKKEEEKAEVQKASEAKADVEDADFEADANE